MKPNTDLYDQLMHVAEHWNTKGHNGDTWSAMLHMSDEITARGVETYNDLEHFLDGYEAHAKAAGRPDLATFDNLFLARNQLLYRASRFPPHGWQEKPVADPLRLAALHDLVTTGARAEDVAHAMIEIIYRDLRHAPHQFMHDFAVYLLDAGRFDLIRSKVMKPLVDRAIHMGGLNRHSHDESFFDTLDKVAFGTTNARVLADKNYIDQVPCFYLGEIARYLPDPDKASGATSESLWTVVGRLGKDKLEKVVEKSRKEHKIAAAKDYSWMEGGMPDYYYTGERLAITEKILAQFDDKAIFSPRLSKPFAKAAVKKPKPAALKPPRPKKSYKL